MDVAVSPSPRESCNSPLPPVLEAAWLGVGELDSVAEELETVDKVDPVPTAESKENPLFVGPVEVDTDVPGSNDNVGEADNPVPTGKLYDCPSGVELEASGDDVGSGVETVGSVSDTEDETAGIIKPALAEPELEDAVVLLVGSGEFVPDAVVRGVDAAGIVLLLPEESTTTVLITTTVEVTGELSDEATVVATVVDTSTTLPVSVSVEGPEVNLFKSKLLLDKKRLSEKVLLVRTLLSDDGTFELEEMVVSG